MSGCVVRWMTLKSRSIGPLTILKTICHRCYLGVSESFRRSVVRMMSGSMSRLSRSHRLARLMPQALRKKGAKLRAVM